MNNNLNWGKLPFAYQKTNYNVRCYYKNGSWGEIEICSSETIPMHMAATSLHYGQEIFEGLKAFKGKDGKVRLFRPEENAKRMQNSADGIMMEAPSEELFLKMAKQVINLNKEFVPPHGTGASLYLRPLLIGTGPRVGVKPADEYLFMIFVTPVGPYFKEGFSPVSMMITREFDRAAPQGTGRFKVGGNYAASLKSMKKAHDDGYANILYLDAKEKKYIDECGPANFFGIKDGTYITPKSDSILPSITNKSLLTLAQDLGYKTERRPVKPEELKDFQEAGACGTAAVISPIGKIYDNDKDIEYTFDSPGKISTQLYKELQSLQSGDIEDRFGWVTIVE
ncbi:MAG: branched-chain amino acid aminotransferase [Bacteroidota bacterium]|nr:branched-chain amino acid aminotransferase [Bacteroidota bacterium]